MGSVGILENLQCLLLRLSSEDPPHRDVFGDLTSMTISNRWVRAKLKYCDIEILANVLYDELERQVESAAKSVDRGEFMVLLRCCVAVLGFLAFDMSLIMQKSKKLLMILRRLCARCLLNSNSGGLGLRKCSSAGDWMNLSSDLEKALLCTIIEVLVDEFLVHPQLGKHLIVADFISDSSERMFASHGWIGDYNAILELISWHYLLIINNGHGFRRFLGSLYWTSEHDFDVCGLDMVAALTLLGLPAISSLPQMLQAHALLLVARSISIRTPTSTKFADKSVFRTYMSVFELSVNLYAGYIRNAKLEIFENSLGDESQSKFHFLGPSCESSIQVATRENIELQKDKLVNFVRKQSQCMLSTSKTDILDKFASYIKENRHVLDECCRDEANLLLNSILSRAVASHSKKGHLHKDGEVLVQELCCLAAALKIISSSLLQIIWFLRYSDILGDEKTLRDDSFHREYELLSSVIVLFRKYVIKHDMQEILPDLIKSNSDRSELSESMFMHFLSLLLYSLEMQLEFLQKDCIFMMMVTLNYIFLEEGSLVMFGPLHTVETSASMPSPSEISEQSILIASNIQNSWKLHSRKLFQSPLNIDQRNVQESCAEGKDDLHNSGAVAANTCNGLAYVKCLGDHEASKWGDMLDFVECTPGKDYSSWFNNKRKFRGWKNQRLMGVKRLLKMKRRAKMFSPNEKIKNHV